MGVGGRKKEFFLNRKKKKEPSISFCEATLQKCNIEINVSDLSWHNVFVVYFLLSGSSDNFWFTYDVIYVVLVVLRQN